PSGLKATVATMSACPVNDARSDLSAVSQSFAVPSALAVTNDLPSGANASPPTQPRWPLSVIGSCPTAAPQSASMTPMAASLTCCRLYARWPSSKLWPMSRAILPLVLTTSLAGAPAATAADDILAGLQRFYQTTA